MKKIAANNNYRLTKRATEGACKPARQGRIGIAAWQDKGCQNPEEARMAYQLGFNDGLTAVEGQISSLLFTLGLGYHDEPTARKILNELGRRVEGMWHSSR